SFIMRQPVLATEHDSRALVQGQILKCVHKVLPQSGIDRLRVWLSFELGLVDTDQFLSFAGVFAEAVIGNPIQPGRKLRFASKATNVFVSAKKSFLGQIICSGNITTGELSEQTADLRLMIPNQFSKGVVIIIEENACDKISIGKRHV